MTHNTKRERMDLKENLIVSRWTSKLTVWIRPGVWNVVVGARTVSSTCVSASGIEARGPSAAATGASWRSGSPLWGCRSFACAPCCAVLRFSLASLASGKRSFCG